MVRQRGNKKWEKRKKEKQRKREKGEKEYSKRRKDGKERYVKREHVRVEKERHWGEGNSQSERG